MRGQSSHTPSKKHTSTYEGRAQTRNSTLRIAFAGLSMLVELIVMYCLIVKLDEAAPRVETVLRIIGLLIVLGIYNKDMSASLKMPWIILILLFPVFGVMFYLLVGLSGTTHRMQKRYEAIDSLLFPLLPVNKPVEEALATEDKGLSNIASYLHAKAGYPLWQDTDVDYYRDAALGLEAQKEALAKAEHFIFMEYHAIEDGEAWHGIEEILARKAREGVLVRLFYDDLGSAGFLTHDFIQKMEGLGIHCRVFNPVNPVLNVFLNNRDHRKITVIDGQVGFTGGYNLANEYFHLTTPYGYWKDTGIKITGSAVRSLTMTFLEMWNAISDKDRNDDDLVRFFPEVKYTAREKCYVQPYADNPIDNLHVGEDVYISLAEQAQDYIWFITPYLIITDEMNHAFSLAARRGVDVRIITPGIPDKKMIYSITRSYYNALAVNGVRIFEYTPGFCHAKMCVSDDKVCTCGTINLDYRSLYHHFENGCVIYGGQTVNKIKTDFETMFSQSREVTNDYVNGRGRFLPARDAFLRLFAPLM